MQHVFQLAAPLAFADIERLTGTLCAMPGVRGIDVAPGSPQLHVQFDEEATSLQAIAEAAANAGYPEVRPDTPGCCGGCCGS